MKPLVEKGEISQQQYDAYLAAARVADSQLSAAKEKLIFREKGAEIARESMLAAKAQVDKRAPWSRRQWRATNRLPFTRLTRAPRRRRWLRPRPIWKRQSCN